EKRGAFFVERRAVLVGEAGEELSDVVLPALARFDFRDPRLLVLPGGGCEPGEAAFSLQARDPFGGGLKVESQRALDSDLVKAEIGAVEHLAHDVHSLNRSSGDRVLLREGPRFAVFEVPEDAGDVANLVGLGRPIGWVPELVTLVAEALRHLHEE